MYSRGYVGLFSKALSQEQIRACVQSWLSRFEKVEQICPGEAAGTVTIPINKIDDLLDDANPQFRILYGQDFTWVYMTRGRFVMETTGLPNEEMTLCMDVLMELPNLAEIIDQENDRRLDQLEAEGLM